MRILGAVITMAGILSGASNAEWRECAPLPLARAGYAAGILGSRLVVAGGSFWLGETKTRVVSVDAYLPECNCWQPEAPMPSAISDAASTGVDGELFVLGGSSEAGATDKVYSFNGMAWRERPEMRLPEPRTNGMAVTAGHSILLIGGLQRPGDTLSGLKTSWVWDLHHANNGWKPLPPCPCSPRASAGAAIVNGKLLLAGGLRADQARIENLSDVWELDLERMVWVPVANLPEGRRAMWAAPSHEGLLLFGGYTNDFRREILLLRDGKTELIGHLPLSVADAKVFEIHGQWYISGGETAIHKRSSATWSGNLNTDGGRH